MKNTGYFSVIILFVALLAVFGLPSAALAQDETPASADNVTLSTEFPKIDGTATDTFGYTVELSYRGEKDRVFELAARVPEGWRAYITPQFDSQRISSISVERNIGPTTKNLKLTVNGPSWPLALPGEYTITVVVSSEDVVGTIDLTAKITPRGILSVAPSNENSLFNTRATAGRDNIFGIDVTNVGTSAIENVTFSPEDKPEGWEISFQPDKLDVLDVLEPAAVDVNIKPPPNTMAGDYVFSLRATGKDVLDPVKLDIRVTVQTPTIWGWVGVAIIIIVVVALFVIFMRFGRR